MMGSNKPKDKFNGSYGDLQAVIEATGARGFWIARGNHCTFRTKDRVAVRWCTTTKTVVFDGRYEAAHKLRDHLTLLAGRGWKNRPGLFDDGGDLAEPRRWPNWFFPDPANDQ